MKASIEEKLARLTERYEEVGQLLSDPEIITNQNRFRDLSKEYAELEPVVQSYGRYHQMKSDRAEAEAMLDDPEMRDMAREELEACDEQLGPLEEELQRLLLPKDPNDGKNVFLEIRAGTGGDEAAIFAGDLFRMYSKYAEQNKY